MRIEKNESGFTLPEILIAVGLLGGISLVTIKLMEDQASNKAHLVAKTEISKAVSMLKATINNPESCSNMLKDQFLSDATSGTAAKRVIGIPPALPYPSLTPIDLEQGLYHRIPVSGTNTFRYKEMLVIGGNYGNFRVNDIRLVRLTNTDTNVDNVNLEILFGVEKKSIFFKSDGNSANDRTYLHKIPLTVTIENSPTANMDRIRDCGIVMSEATLAAKRKFCESLGNMAKWNNDKCQFRDLRCGYNHVPSRQTALGTSTYECVPIVDKFDAADLFDQAPCVSPSGQFKVMPVNGKLRIVCD